MKNIFLKFLLLFVFSLLALAVYWSDPNSPNTYMPDCPTEKFLCFYCPGCGATRAFYALMHFDLKEALSQNFLFVCFLPLILLLIFYPRLANIKYFPHIVLVLIVSFSILRNLPAFIFLAPH